MSQNLLLNWCIRPILIYILICYLTSTAIIYISEFAPCDFYFRLRWLPSTLLNLYTVPNFVPTSWKKWRPELKNCQNRKIAYLLPVCLTNNRQPGDQQNMEKSVIKVKIRTFRKRVLPFQIYALPIKDVKASCSQTGLKASQNFGLDGLGLNIRRRLTSVVTSCVSYFTPMMRMM